ncbi:hypothetical protein CATMIT_01969, partial [Catenibacterium mitsuokai DSM 15897]
RHRVGIHVEDLPGVAVQIVVSALVHEAVVLRLVRLRTGGDGLVGQRIDLGAAAQRQRHQGLHLALRIDQLLLGEGLEERPHQQHREQILAEQHAGGVLVGELRVEAVAERGEESDRTVEVLHRQVDEHLGVGGHGVSPGCEGKGTAGAGTGLVRPHSRLLMTATSQDRRNRQARRIFFAAASDGRSARPEPSVWTAPVSARRSALQQRIRPQARRRMHYRRRFAPPRTGR